MSVEDFRARARSHAPRPASHGPRPTVHAPRLVPVWRDVLLDAETPVAAFAKLRNGPFAFLLESAPAGGETWARYTFMGTAPRAAWKLVDGTVQDWTADRGWHNDRRPDDPLVDLEALLRDCEPVEVPEIGEFWSGAVGYFGYDVARIIERLPAPPARGVDVPDALFVFTDALVIFDNLRSQARVVATARVSDSASDAELQTAYDAALRTIDATVARLRGPSVLAPLELDTKAAPAEGESRYDKAKFLVDVERVREYIIAGDAFQVQIARRIDVPFDFSSTDLYRALRVINPSPYMYHLVLDGVEIVGSSPELLVRVSAQGTVTLRPIAGTRRRGRTEADDAAMTAELIADEKERAEHLMLVDLGRNDVGRVAKYGSVRVSELMVVERYSHVLHLVSQVDGELRDDLTAMDAFRAGFPAGTLTGAPKVRAMEIIDEMEPERRGPYGGAVGYISAGVRRMDLAITIRTCVIANGVASIQSAAGVVYDSVPEREFLEHQNKARALLTAIGQIRPAKR
ncbi:MAG: anthranilate synthase component [Gemmatimonadetes bacterium]|nr:anthranilate synthase component [Gemmatimonadota bacterium]